MDITLEEKPTVTSSSDEELIKGRVNLEPLNEPAAPLEESKVEMMLELTGSGPLTQRPGLDLVAVLDISTSMGDGGKLQRLIQAMKFVIKKLTPSDRLSIVTFDENAEVLCGLRVMDDGFKAVIEGKVDALAYRGNTNIADGLKTGLNVLEAREFKENRVAAVMLMSDGEQNRGGNAADVDNKGVPVFSFGFGMNQDPKVLKKISEKTPGGTFSDASNLDNLNTSFGQILGLLVTVVVQDLTLNLRAIKKTQIIHVYDGSNKKEPENASFYTVLYGFLSDKESRKVTLELLLPLVDKDGDTAVIEADFSYKVKGEPVKSIADTYTVDRLRNPVRPMKKEMIMEMKRMKIAQLMRAARKLAEDANLAEAKKKLIEAQQSLDGEDEESNPLVTTLNYELDHLLGSLRSLDVFKQIGLPFALSSETSHNRQRFAARGDPGQVRLFATPRVNDYLEQAKSFDEDPDIELPTADDDAKQELLADPLGPIAGALNYHIQSAIQSLMSIANILNKSRGV